MTLSRRKYNKKGGMDRTKRSKSKSKSRSLSKSRTRSKSKNRSRSRPRVMNLQIENVDQLGLDIYRIKQDIEKIFLEINLIKSKVGLSDVSKEIIEVDG